MHKRDLQRLETKWERLPEVKAVIEKILGS